ncbi:MAG: hypothetical protein IJD48_03325, partial [Clostridia bacterium]|nr:hypothetical protein [Clostridia bacterium]
MSELKILLKNNFNIFLGSLKGKKNRRLNASMITLLLLGVLGVLGLYSYQAWIMCEGLGAFGLQDVCLFHAVSMTLLVMVFIGVARVSGKANGNDTEFLMSLPLKKINIILSKLVGRYLFDLMFVVLLLLPYIIIYQIVTNFSIYLTLVSLLVILLFPFLSIGISYICDFIITRIFNKIRLGNFLKTMFVLLVFVVLMSLMILKSFTYGTANPTNLEEYFSDRIFSNLVLKILIDPSVLVFVLFLALMFIPFAVGLGLYVCNYGKSFGKYINKNLDLKFSNNTSGFVGLFKKEVRSYFTKPAYFVNTILGATILPIVAVFIMIKGAEGVLQFFGIGIINTTDFSFWITIIFLFALSMCFISACSVSLEGKQFWLLKSSPIKESTIFLSKISLHFVILETVSLISLILMNFALKLPILQFLLISAIITIFVLLTAVSGLFVNLMFPKMNWSDETRVVKQ